MNPSKILRILAIVISLFGVGYMGYATGKGLDDNYGLWSK